MNARIMLSHSADLEHFIVPTNDGTYLLYDQGPGKPRRSARIRSLGRARRLTLQLAAWCEPRVPRAVARYRTGPAGGRQVPHVGDLCADTPPGIDADA